jgi:polyhydroxyalkanoate synthesis regulator phasin
MDGFAVTWRVQRRLQTRVRRSLDVWLGLWHLPSRTDVARVSNEIAALERQVRELRAEVGRPKGGG